MWVLGIKLKSSGLAVNPLPAEPSWEPSSWVYHWTWSSLYKLGWWPMSSMDLLVSAPWYCGYKHRPQHWLLNLSTEILSLDPHAYKAGTLPTELSPQFLPISFLTDQLCSGNTKWVSTSSLQYIMLEKTHKAATPLVRELPPSHASQLRLRGSCCWIWKCCPCLISDIH